jgi:purine nucleosidase
MRGLLRLLSVVFVLAVLAWSLVPWTAWWTGRMAPSRLVLVPGGPEVAPVGRVWIDTDAACGAGPRTDPDDCFAILWLLARDVEVVGISTSFGNAPGPVVVERTAALVERMRATGIAVPPVLEGYGGPEGSPDLPAGVLGLREALADGPLTVLALGPLTNVAAALERRPELAANVQRVVAVMGHEAGHLFHPSEGNGRGLMGHGPIFRDLNVSVDVEAARRLMEMGLPVTLIPYDAGRGVVIDAGDLERFGRQGPAQGWLSAQAGGWLEFWQEDVGLAGFSPFDWVAAGYLVAPGMFDCAEVTAGVRLEFALWIWPRNGLVVEEGSGTGMLYCPRTAPGLHDLLLTP